MTQIVMTDHLDLMETLTHPVQIATTVHTAQERFKRRKDLNQQHLKLPDALKHQLIYSKPHL